MSDLNPQTFEERITGWIADGSSVRAEPQVDAQGNIVLVFVVDGQPIRYQVRGNHMMRAE